MAMDFFPMNIAVSVSLRQLKCKFSSHQVSRVTDVVSVGQQLTLMCISQDVRGNIKLSLKATLSQRKPNSQNVTEQHSSSAKEVSNIWASIEDKPNETEENNSQLKSSTSIKPKTSVSSVPSILIRSAAECDEADKCAEMLKSSAKSVSKL